VVTVKNVETIRGGLGAPDQLADQYVILGGPARGALFDLGEDYSSGNTANVGMDVVDFGDFNSSARIVDTEIIIGGRNSQNVTLLSPFTNANISHGGS
jgi:hypothetical protein